MAGEYAPEIVADLEGMVRVGLPRWGLSAGTDIRLLNLSENATFGLQDAGSGRDWVLRVHRVGYSSVEEIRSELAWIDALRQDGIIDTAAPVPGVDGDLVQVLHSPSARPARHAVMFEKLTGGEPDAGNDTAPWFERLGELTARMHEHARTWALPPAFRRKRWDVESIVGANAHWGPWRAAIGLDGAGRAVIERALGVIEPAIAAYGTGSDRFGLVHADMRLANLIVDGARLQVIDFDDCGFSWFVYDFAAAISFIEHEPFVPELLAAWLSGYRSQAVLSEADRAVIPAFVLLRRIQLTAWLASHSEIAFARERGAAFTAQTVRLADDMLHEKLLR